MAEYAGLQHTQIRAKKTAGRGNRKPANLLKSCEPVQLVKDKDYSGDNTLRFAALKRIITESGMKSADVEALLDGTPKELTDRLITMPEAFLKNLRWNPAAAEILTESTLTKILEAEYFFREVYPIQYRSGEMSIDLLRNFNVLEAYYTHIPQTIKDHLTMARFKTIHSISVQGGYEGNSEFIEAVPSRVRTGAREWLNLIWVYQSSREKTVIDHLPITRHLNIQGLDLFETDFREAVRLWPSSGLIPKPPWVDSFLDILDILNEKKSYVAMSDIMRMIILYYQGGLYMDLKIQIASEGVRFFDYPRIDPSLLYMADAGRRIENWAMIANAGSLLISEVMERVLHGFPEIPILKGLPENYSRLDAKGRRLYSQPHIPLHEDFGPFPKLQQHHSDTGSHRIEEISDIELDNPRTTNSWFEHDSVEYDWEKGAVIVSSGVLTLDHICRTMGMWKEQITLEQFLEFIRINNAHNYRLSASEYLLLNHIELTWNNKKHQRKNYTYFIKSHKLIESELEIFDLTEQERETEALFARLTQRK